LLRAQDKAISRFQVRNMVETAAQRDVKEASVYETYVIPKMYVKLVYCVSCAVHAHVVRSRPAVQRRVRDPPMRLRFGEAKPNVGKPQKGVKKSARCKAKLPELESYKESRQHRERKPEAAE
jgi:small subunit ribosomal protein S26e